MNDSEIKDKICEQGIEVNQKNELWAQTPNKNDMMSITGDIMDARLKWCQYYKNQNWDLVIFSDETVFNDLRKSKKKWVHKGKDYRAPKTGKRNHKVNVLAIISRTEKFSLNYLLMTWILMLI